jgi:hypothetical protein
MAEQQQRDAEFATGDPSPGAWLYGHDGRRLVGSF